MRMIWRLPLAVIAIAAAAACASTGEPTDAWSRSYLAPEDTVFEAAVEVLEDEGYFVEADRAAGRLVAEPPDVERGRPMLVLRIKVTGERVVVDVQARPGADAGPVLSERTDAAVLELLHALDRRMQGMRD